MGRPDFHNRVFTLISAGGPSGGPVGTHRYMFNEEWISGEITGMSTQFDALSHIGRQLGKNGDNNTSIFFDVLYLLYEIIFYPHYLIPNFPVGSTTPRYPLVIVEMKIL